MSNDVDVFDITTKVGELDEAWRPPEWPMHSFSRPSRILWNAIGQRLSEKGWSEKRIREWLQSRETRMALDGALGEELERVGREYAEHVEAA